MATITVPVWTAWLPVSYLVIPTATVLAYSSSNLRSSLFTLITCPSTATAACATETVPTESYNGVSLCQCTIACNRINGCNYYNYIEPDDHDKCGRGQCELFTNQPLNLSSTALCRLFKVSKKLWFSLINNNVANVHSTLLSYGVASFSVDLHGLCRQTNNSIIIVTAWNTCRSRISWDFSVTSIRYGAW